MYNVNPPLSSPKGTAFGGITLLSTKTLYIHKQSLAVKLCFSPKREEPENLAV